MQNLIIKVDLVEKIEDLLDEVFEDLSCLDEHNFTEKFASATQKMNSVRDITSKKGLKTNDFKPSRKIIQMAKLISEKYDNLIQDWADKLKVVQKEIELTQNQKKITIYNR